MGWIKRNLLFVVGGAIAVVLLGAGGFYTFKAWSHNSESTEKITEIYGTLKKLQTQSPAPGNDKINNTTIAKEQTQKVQAWIAGTGKYFQPVDPIPSGAVTSEAFASALRLTIDLLQREADAASVTLPPKYDFSFSAQRNLVKFAPGSLEPLAAQLGEVRAILETLFSARINALDGLQRLRVSEDDMKGAQGDYMDGLSVTNELAVITPYVINFRSFSPELAGTTCAFANSSNAFLIKAINVQPASAAAGAGDMPAGYAVPPGMEYPQGYPQPNMAPGGYVPGMRYPQPGVAPGQLATARGGLPTVLKEQLLRVTMEVDIVKLLPNAKK